MIKRNFDRFEMQQAIKEMIKNECIVYDNLTVDAAKSVGADFLVRRICNGMDYEKNIASINEETSGLDTIC